MERFPAKSGGGNPQHYRWTHDAEFSSLRRSCYHPDVWDDIDSSRYLSVGGVHCHAISELGMVGSKRNRSYCTRFYAGEELANHQPLLPGSRGRNRPHSPRLGLDHFLNEGSQSGGRGGNYRQRSSCSLIWRRKQNSLEGTWSGTSLHVSSTTRESV